MYLFSKALASVRVALSIRNYLETLYGSAAKNILTTFNSRDE
jgi:hypothetical protein